MGDCKFCKIIRKETSDEIVYETKDVLVFKDIKPVAPVHVLIVPKKHTLSFSETMAADSKLVGNMMRVIIEVAEKMGISDGYKVDLTSGDIPGHEASHFHIHLFGGWKIQS